MSQSTSHSSRRRSSRSASEAARPAGRYDKAAAVLIAGIPMLATVGYGAVDIWALIPLSALSAFLAAVWLLDSLKNEEFRYSTSALQLSIGALTLLGCVQLLPLGPGGQGLPGGAELAGTLTLDPFSTGYFVIRLLLLLMFFAAALTFLNAKRRVRRVMLAIVIFGALMAFAGILQRLASPDAIYGMRPTPQAIPFGPFVNQHHFAAFMEMTIGLGLAALLGDAVKRDRRALLVIALALMMIAVLMTGSRGGMIALFSVVAFVTAANYAGRAAGERERFRFGALHAAGAAAIIVIVAGSVLFLAGADPLVRGLGMQAGQTDVTGGRLHFWSVALKIFVDNPIVGAGLDAFGVAFTRYDTWNGVWRVEQAHNDYLQILADGGVIGLACVAGFIFLLFRRGLTVIRRSSSPGRRSIAVGALAGCFGILVHSFFDFPLRTPSNAYFFLLLAAMATVPLGDEREPSAD